MTADAAMPRRLFGAKSPGGAADALHRGTPGYFGKREKRQTKFLQRQEKARNGTAFNKSVCAYWILSSLNYMRTMEWEG